MMQISNKNNLSEIICWRNAMGTDQTHLCQNDPQKTVFNNVRNVDDHSSHGLSLQRKADAAHNNANVMQRMAWVAVKKNGW